MSKNTYVDTNISVNFVLSKTIKEYIFFSNY